MKEEDFIKVWKDSDRDRILHQYYYDYLEMQRLGNIIDELEKHLKYQIKDFEVDGYDLPSVREQSLWLSGCYDESKLILDKLEELKEGDK